MTQRALRPPPSLRLMGDIPNSKHRSLLLKHVLPRATWESRAKNTSDAVLTWVVTGRERDRGTPYAMACQTLWGAGYLRAPRMLLYSVDVYRPARILTQLLHTPALCAADMLRCGDVVVQTGCGVVLTTSGRYVSEDYISTYHAPVLVDVTFESGRVRTWKAATLLEVL